MFLARYGRYIGDAQYCYDETVRQLSVAFDCCEKDGSGLLYHAYSENPDVLWAHPITGKSPEIWCEGLGWYAMILSDVLELMPRTQPGYDRLLMQLNKLVRGLSLVQDVTSGLWYQVVDKVRAKKNWHDTSGSAMFLYCIKKALELGLVDARYSAVAEAAFAGLKTKWHNRSGGKRQYPRRLRRACVVQLDYDAYVYYARNVNWQGGGCRRSVGGDGDGVRCMTDRL